MSRGAQSFKQRDVTKAIKAVVKAGVNAGRVEFEPGKFTVFFGAPETAGEPEAATPTDSNVNEWDTVK